MMAMIVSCTMFSVSRFLRRTAPRTPRAILATRSPYPWQTSV